MRIWDIEPERLCRNHLLGEHRELHAIWSILTKNKKGYAHHPETMRWRGKLKALYLRHEKLTGELKKRGYKHNSMLNKIQAVGLTRQNQYVDPIRRQLRKLRRKKCGCKLS
ncbi:MAG: pyrimidine dimer DNA glycosylase [Omnitrophica WOR_2 bacterium SM23_72]|nr:MAG: pyrimidine dimer DNA glycosylase [Omnitrophica WOR_2 bacterium SM23_72]